MIMAQILEHLNIYIYIIYRIQFQIECEIFETTSVA